MNLFTVVVATFICIVEGQSPCLTPSGNNGLCKPVGDCPSLSALLSYNVSPEDKDLLKKSQCGIQGNMPEVCCPETCYTPDGQTGTCVNIGSCEKLSNMLQPPVSKENMAFVENSKCSGEEQQLVCCPARNSLHPTQPGNCKDRASVFPPDPSTDCCGDGGFGSKLLGGNVTQNDEHPWLALIEYFKPNTSRPMLLCGGTLISGRYVLTAGYCVTRNILGFDPKNVRLGEYDTKHDGPDCMDVGASDKDCTDGAVSIPIESTIPHPDYNLMPEDKKNDIALIRLKKTAPYTDFIRPICLPTADINLAPSDSLRLLTAGWSTGKSSVLNSKELGFVKLEDCQKTYETARFKSKLWKGQLCAGGEALTGSCTGDGGGPLIHRDINRRSEIVGVISFGPKKCASKGIPTVYTNVYEYNTWIRSNIKP